MAGDRLCRPLLSCAGGGGGLGELRDLAVRALRSSRAAYAEIRYEAAGECHASAHGTRLASAFSTADEGGYARVRVGDAWGFASFAGAADLVPALRRAAAGARLAGVPAGAGGRPATPVPRAPRGAGGAVPAVAAVEGETAAPWPASAGEAADALCQMAFAFPPRPSLSVPRLRLLARTTRVLLANSDGCVVESCRSLVEVRVALALLDQRWRAGLTWHVRGTLDRPLSAGVLRDAAQAFAREALDMAAARPVRAGRHTVVLHPEVAGLLAHYAGHCFEADRHLVPTARGNRPSPGQRVAGVAVTLVDSGLVPGEAGSIAVDDEGEPAGVTHLVREGVVTGHLHSRETALAEGARPTGNGRTATWRFPPLPRMTNTYFEPSALPAGDLVSDAMRGVYVRRASGGRDGGAFAITATVAYAIRRGRPAWPLSGVMLRADPLGILACLDAVGDDLGWSGRATCNRGAQHCLPVGMGGPHVRLQGVYLG
jgi:TldD protein